MKIVHKLAIGIILNLVIVFGISLIGYYGIDRLRKEIDTLISDPIPSIITASKLSQEFLSATEDIYAYQALGVLEEKKGFESHVREFDKTLKEFKLLIEDYAPEQKEISSNIVKEIEAKWGNFKKVGQNAILNYDANKKADVDNLNSIFNTVEDINPLLLKLIDFEEKEITQAQEKTDKVTQKSLSFMLFIISISIISSIIINLIIMRSVLVPIRFLKDSVSGFGKGDFQKRSKILENDEFGELAIAFNAMADRISASQSDLEAKIKDHTAELEKANLELKNINTNLEQAVSERTIELEQAKSSLEEEVTNRTKELSEKVVEAEKANRLMIDRELAMAEIKEKNRKLLEEIEELKKGKSE